MWVNNMLNSKKTVLAKRNSTLLVLTLFTLFSLLFSTASFAVDENDLMDAIRQNNFVSVRNLLRRGVDPQKIIFFCKFPSREIVELLLGNKNKPLGINKFFELILMCEERKWNHEKKFWEDDELLANQKECWVNFALENGADPNEIDNFRVLPSIKLCNIMLRNEKKTTKTKQAIFVGFNLWQL